MNSKISKLRRLEAQQSSDQHSAPKSHIVWINHAKGIGIFLVVIGHTLRGLFANDLLLAEGLPASWNNWIYSFHMPLFFFISGLFIQSSVSKSISRFLKKRLQFVVYPYLLWSWIHIFLKLLVYAEGSDGINFKSFLTIFYQPIDQFWFFYVLLVLSLLYVGFYRLNVSNSWFMIASIFMTAPFLLSQNILTWSVLVLVSRFMFYFALGVVMSHNQLQKLSRIQPIYLLLFTGLSFSLIFHHAHAYWLKGRVYDVGFALLGIAGCIALSLALSKTNKFNFIADWGKYSLEIYVMHTVASAAIRTVLVRGWGYTGLWGHLILGTAVGIAIPLMTKKLCERFDFPYLFTWGSR